MRRITINQSDFQTPAELMAWLKSALGFPEWCGNSLPALYDCLGDTAEPTEITIVRRDAENDTWFDKAVIAVIHSCLENENLSCRIR